MSASIMRASVPAASRAAAAAAGNKSPPRLVARRRHRAPVKALAAAARRSADPSSPTPAAATQPLPSTAALATAWLALASPALALDEAAAVAPDAAAATADAAAAAQNPGTIVLAAWPILMYALFNFVIRPKVNPRAGFGDFIYFLVFSVIVLNLVCGLFFNFRLF
jgi:hypothetical protein